MPRRLVGGRQGGKLGRQDATPCACGRPRDHRRAGMRSLDYMCLECRRAYERARIGAKRRQRPPAQFVAAPPPRMGAGLSLSGRTPLVVRPQRSAVDAPWLRSTKQARAAEEEPPLTWLLCGELVRSCGSCGAVTPAGAACKRCGKQD